MSKKIFAISTLLLVLLIGAIFVYNFAFKKPTAPTAAPKTIDEGKTSPAPAKNQPPAKQTGSAITAISDSAVFGATLGPDGNSLYYFAGDNGQLNQIDTDGKLEKVVSTEEFQNIRQVIWNKPKSKAYVVSTDTAGKPKIFLLDLAQKSVTPLNGSINYVTWSSLGDKLIYAYTDPATQKRSLNIADPDGANWKKITDITFFSVAVSPVPGSSAISYWPAPDAFTSTSANVIGSGGENKKEILAGRFGADLLWSPDGRSAAVSDTDQKGGKKTYLALINSDGGQFQNLNLPTFAKKCTWSADSKFLYCAMPGPMPPSAILPNDWQEGKIRTADTFWKIEVATDKRDHLIDPSKINDSFDVFLPFLSQDEKTLFFTNKADGKLYKLGL